MNVNSKRLVGVPVRTKAGTPLGKLASFEMDADTGKLVSLLVKVSGVTHMLERELCVPWACVISLSEQEIVVSDATVPIGTTVLADQFTPSRTG